MRTLLGGVTAPDARLVQVRGGWGDGQLQPSRARAGADARREGGRPQRGRRSGQPGVESRFRPLQPGPGGGPLNVLTEKTRLAHRPDGLSAGEAGGFGYLPGRFLGVAL